MKKLIAILSLFLLLYIAGCISKNFDEQTQIIDNFQNNADISDIYTIDIDNFEELSKKQSEQNNLYDLMIYASDSIDVSGMNIYKQDENIRFVNERNASITLYVNAMEGEYGFAFDDVCKSILVMKTPFGDFQLFPSEIVPEYLHHVAGAEYFAFNDFNNKKNLYGDFNVMVTVQGSAVNIIYNCIFNSEEKAFKVVPIYFNENINSESRSSFYRPY